jgi:RNA polymerase sigma factor
MARLPEDPQDLIRRIQTGDQDLREHFIESSLPLIKRIVRQMTHSFFVEQEDEYVIALEAYNRALDTYKVDGVVPFEPYARLLIKHRILDWIRRKKSIQPTLSLSDRDSEEGLSLEEQLADPMGNQIEENLEFEDAIVLLELQLAIFGLNLAGLTNWFPKHQDSRLLCIRIARQLSTDHDLYTRLMQTKRLPGAELSRRCQTPLKTIEKNRANIIFLTLLIKSELQVINSYIAVYEKEGSK